MSQWNPALISRLTDTIECRNGIILRLTHFFTDPCPTCQVAIITKTGARLAFGRGTYETTAQARSIAINIAFKLNDTAVRDSVLYNLYNVDWDYF